jgi:predicted protein tyrosine phosphatase
MRKLFRWKVLFVCSRNRRRSLTAEHLFKGMPSFEVRSAGTQPSARIAVTERLLSWADVILVMEKSHLRRLEERYPQVLETKKVITLHIADEYEFMEPELIDVLRAKVPPLLENACQWLG